MKPGKPWAGFFPKKFITSCFMPWQLLSAPPCLPRKWSVAKLSLEENRLARFSRIWGPHEMDRFLDPFNRKRPCRFVDFYPGQSLSHSRREQNRSGIGEKSFDNWPGAEIPAS